MADLGSPVRDGAELCRRMQAFLADEARGGPEIADLIGHLGQVGEVAIFGGMARDIARGGAAAFASDVDLVVLGARGLGAIERFVLGSVSEGVLRHADRPVLIVKGHPA